MPIVGYSRVSGFSPLSLSPSLWLDASDAATITSSGGAVSQWSDKAGTNHCTQSVAGSKPTTGATTQNGRNVIDFGGDDFLDYATSLQPTAGGGLSVVAVARRTNADGGTLVSERRTTQVRAFAFAYASIWYISSDGVNAGSNHDIATGDYNLTASAFQTTFTSVSGSRMGFRINGTAKTVNAGSATNLTGSAGGRIGRREGTFSYWTGWMAEIIAVPAVLTSQQITDVETYLKNKWGTP